MTSQKLKVLDLFSGIGGFSLGLERTGGFSTVAFCEIEEYPRKVLAKHWPSVPVYTDVRELTGDRLRADGIAVDVITGGFPCQDLSVAGKQAGIHGERSGLFGEIIRLAGELRPSYIILENVAALLTGDNGGWARHVFGSLAEVGFDAEWHVIPAGNLDGLSAGAPHRRERVWIVAYPESTRGGNVGKDVGEAFQQKHSPDDAGCSCGRVDKHGNGQDVAYTNNAGLERREKAGNTGSIRTRRNEHAERRRDDSRSTRATESRLGLLAHGLHARLSRPGWLAEPGIGRVASGVPDRAKKLKALGNSVVPQIPEAIGYAILARESA